MIYNRVYNVSTQLATKKDDAHTHKKGTLHTHAHSDAL